MNLKKKTLAIVSIIVLAVALLAQTVVYAADASPRMVFGISKLRDRGGIRMGYGIGDPKNNGEYVWNIKKYNSTGDSGTGTNVPAYCLKGHQGFLGGHGAKAEYDKVYDMLSERTQLAAQNSILSGLVNGGHYNQILAVLDLFYIPEASSASTDRTALLTAAGVPTTTEYADYLLTDNDIEAVQQAALWYFTNYGDSSYNKYQQQRWMNYSLDGENYSSFSDYQIGTGEGQERQEYMESLYKYLIDTANENANNYANGTQSTQPITINKDSAQITESGNYYEIGPITVTKNNNSPVTLTLTVQNGSSGIQYDVLNERKGTSTLDNMKKGGTFYIRVQKSVVTSTVNLNFGITSTTTGMKAYARSLDNQEQPIVLLDRTPKTENVTLSLTPEQPKIFDLALRKYITGIERKSVENTRVPNIDESTLRNDTTATYKHRKDPLEVETGDIVTYTITVYNEGEIAGRATKITDQLPTGLEYVEGSVQGNYEKESYDTGTNKLVLRRTNTNNIEAYPGTGDPHFESVTIKCEVKATAGTSNKVLTNVAWISEDANADGNVTDRDSSPAEAPQVRKDNMSDYKGKDNPSVTPGNPEGYWKGQQDDDDFEKLVIPGSEPDKAFDLALRKYITEIDEEPITDSRDPQPDTSALDPNGEKQTAEYNHRKDPVAVSTETVVTYAITVYNEGEIAGRASEITDKLPEGLEYIEGSVQGNYDAEYDSATNTLVLTRKDTNNLNPFTGGEDLDSDTVTIKCKVTATKGEDQQVLTNVAWISEDASAEGEVTDRDSSPEEAPGFSDTDLNNSDENAYKGHSDNKDVSSDEEYHWKGKQDDDDFEKLVIPGEKAPGEADLRLIKRITKVNDREVEERIKSVDVSNLNTKNSTQTDADIEMNKNPVQVQTGDIVEYTFRVYNEGYVDAYAEELTEDIPEGLEFIYDEQGRTDEELENAEDLTEEEKEAIKFNQDMLWVKAGDNMIKTTYLSKDNEKTSESNLIPAFGDNDGSKTEDDLKYKEVSVKLRVISTDKTGAIIRNEAEISKSKDKNGDDLKDRDSDTELWKKYEDDEDYDNIVLESFDLALRKFIIAVSHDQEIDDSEYLMESDGKTYSRAPVVDASRLNEVDENGNKITTAIYKHPKTPVDVTVGDTVIYMLRVYNEGDIDGYAAEIKDHLPNYLEFVDGEFNEQYGWQVSEDGKTLTTDYLKDKLIEKVTENENGEKVLDYEEIPVMCKVKMDAQTDYKITNIADITVYEDEEHNPATDRDSSEDNVDSEKGNKPEYKDDETGEYVPGQEDDDDFEKVVVRIFDLSLRKWVSQAIVTENGKTTTIDTGHTPYDDPEQLVKVDLSKKKLENTVVKFRFGIRITNDGGIAGSATEITDHIPAGLTMIESENPDWTYVGDNTVTTNKLQDVILQPGEYADVEILLTWDNSEDNLGLKTNVAEISKDYNEKGIPDIDSIPGNQKEGEDDIDDAQVILSLVTGKAVTYILLGTTVLAMLAGGITLIKKYVMK